MKRVYIHYIVGISIVLCCSVYVALYFVLKDNYSSISNSYYRYALGNRIMGEVAEANRLVLQSRYHSKIVDADADKLLFENYQNVLDRFQALIKNYTLPYLMDVYIDNTTIHQFKSD